MSFAVFRMVRGSARSKRLSALSFPFFFSSRFQWVFLAFCLLKRAIFGKGEGQRALLVVATCHFNKLEVILKKTLSSGEALFVEYEVLFL